jgi:hypothetical protein
VSTQTTNLKLTKPDNTEFYDIAVQNTNMDLIDQAVNEKADKSEIPITLPANGGNADTLDGKHGSAFLKDLGLITNDSGINIDTFDDYSYVGYLSDYSLSSVPHPHGVIKHFKTNSSPYVYQEFTKLYDQTTYKRTKFDNSWSEWTKLDADTLDGLHANDFFKTDVKVGIPNFDLNDLVDSGFYTIQPTGAPNPTANKPLDDWGTCIHIKHESTYHQIALYTSGTKAKTYRRSFMNTAWTAWSDLDAADTLEGASRFDLLQHYRNGIGLDLTSNIGTQPYSANINETLATSIGLENAWWHLMYLPHTSSGFGMQIVFPLNSISFRPKYRISVDTVWQSWRLLNDNTYVQSTAPSSPQTNDLWIW